MKEKLQKNIFISLYGLMCIILLLFLILCIVVSICMGEGTVQTIIILSATALIVVAAIIAVNIESKIGSHICKKCNHKFQPTFKETILAPHIGFTRFLKCPKCNEKSWCKKTLEK